MGDTNIEWTDKTWNPTRGCSRVSPGCGGPARAGGCYAEKIAARFSKPGQPYEGLAEMTEHGGRWTGKVKLINHMLAEPFRWREPRRVFVNSMSDLFHDALAAADIAEVFGVMAVAGQVFLSGAKTLVYGYRYDKGLTNRRPLRSYGQEFGPHTFQVLTKRSNRMRQLMNSLAFRDLVASAAYRYAHDRVCAGALCDEIRKGQRWPLPNVWLGVSVEDQERADERIPDLLATPAAVRFLSCEPLLGPLNLTRLGHDGDGVIDALRGEDWVEQWLDADGHERKRVVINRRPRVDWVICGGESGPRKRPTDSEWHRSLRDQCSAASVAFYEKQIDKVKPIPDDLMIREFPA